MDGSNSLDFTKCQPVSMPELPEVEMARRYLEATSLSQTIVAAKVKDPRILFGVSAKQIEQTLAGRKFNSVSRHGKRLFLNLGEDLCLTLHLGLTGDLLYFQNEDDEPGHTRLIIRFENGRFLAYDDTRMFGEVGFASSPQRFLKEHMIGPDALEIDREGFMEIMRGKNRIIKAALLDQSLIAGLGNLYADEALFQSGICPKARHLDDSQLDSLFTSIQHVLITALNAHAILGELPESFLLPHRRPEGICPRDGAALRHDKIGGRTSYYCPMHQRV
jgi:formamidopyrimidine-DNA glycosylase